MAFGKFSNWMPPSMLKMRTIADSESKHLINSNFNFYTCGSKIPHPKSTTPQKKPPKRSPTQQFTGICKKEVFNHFSFAHNGNKKSTWVTFRRIQGRTHPPNHPCWSCSPSSHFLVAPPDQGCQPNKPT